MEDKIIFRIEQDKKLNYIEYIKQRNETKTFELYKKLIDKLDEYEEYKGVLARNMTKIDFLNFFTMLNSSSLSVLFTYKSAINSYLIYDSDIQQFTMGILELAKITPDELISCINKNAESMQFITEEEYYKILRGDKGNWQDKLVLVLLWNGIKGERNFDEILNLKNEDVDLKNHSIYVNNRVVKLDTDLELEIIKNAMEEKVYIKTSIDSEGIENQSPLDYKDGIYLVKATDGTNNRSLESNQCTFGTFANRMSKFYNLVLRMSGLSNARIYKSSVYYHMLKEHGRKLQLKEITHYFYINNFKISLSNSGREQDVMYKKMEEQGIFL